jgi:pimeloyl-ACP methyl ester carboxylesterase
VLAGLVALVVGGGLAVEHAGASAIVYAPNAGHPPSPVEDAPVMVAATGLEARALRVDVGPPRASLALWVVGPAAPRATVFVLHGIRDQKGSMLGWGERLAGMGYRAVLVDSRGHGRSSGDYLSYGVVEARDLAQALDGLHDQGLAVGKIGVMGVSYGAATAIAWAGVDPRVAAVVAVAPFQSLRAVVPDYAKRLVPGVGGLIPDFLIDRAIARAGRTGGFDPGDSPLEAITRTRAPVLLVHGREDVNILPSHSEALHARALDHSELLLLDGEDHVTIAGDRTGALWGRAAAWLKRALDPG